MDDDLLIQFLTDGTFDPPPETTCAHCGDVIADGETIYTRDADGATFCAPCVESANGEA